MAVTNYYSVNGQIVGEKTAGSSRVDYLTDALGSVTGTVDQSANVINTYRYKPFGGLLAKTGVGSDPAFQWVGSQGYRKTGKSYADVYIRARHYSSAQGRWTTKDPLQRRDAAENRYSYSLNMPVTEIDPTGLEPIKMLFDAFIAKKLNQRSPIGGPWFLQPAICEDAAYPLPDKCAPIWYFEGDDRDFFAGKGIGSSRLYTLAGFDSPLIGNLARSDVWFKSEVGVTTRKCPHFISSGWEYQKARATPVKDSYIVKNSAPCESTIELKHAAGYPFCAGSGRFTSIDYDVTFTFRIIGVNLIRASIKGFHKMFPFYEGVVAAGGYNWNLWQYDSTTFGQWGPNLLNLRTFVNFTSRYANVNANALPRCGCPRCFPP